MDTGKKAPEAGAAPEGDAKNKEEELKAFLDKKNFTPEQREKILKAHQKKEKESRKKE